MSKRAIPAVDNKAYAEPGTIRVLPRPHEQEVMLEIHFCSVYLSRVECLTLILQLIQGGQAMWGEEFMRSLQLFLEQRDGG